MQIPITVIAQIVLGVVNAWNEQKRTEFKRKYHTILSKLQDAQNSELPDYTDAAIDVLDEDLEIFMGAFANEINK